MLFARYSIRLGYGAGPDAGGYHAVTRAEDIAGHVGYVLLVLGLLCLAEGLAVGWVLRLLGEAIWVVLGGRMGSTSIVVWGGLGMAVELYGLVLAVG